MTGSDFDDPDRDAATMASARGDHDGVVQAWRRILSRHPEDWEAALAFKTAFRLTGRYAEADPSFRAARRLFPDEVWLAHMAALYAFPHDELPSLVARARSLAGAMPECGMRAELLGAMLMQARDYAGAALAFASAATRGAARQAIEARRYLATAEFLASAEQSGPEFAVVVINLDRNPDRLAKIETQFACCRPPRFRVAGVDASPLPRAAVSRLGGQPAERGTLGCFLAHVAAWEAMLARRLPFCLVIEDDVIPLFDLPERLGVFGVPEGFDLCFVNHRMAPSAAGVIGFTAVPVSRAMRAFPTWANAPGADGYLLSAAGAAKLLAWTARDGFGHDVDWRLLAYCLAPGDIGALADGHAKQVLGQLQGSVASVERLEAFALSPPLIRTVPVASDREDGNRFDQSGGSISHVT